jgi:hypothetical protein
VNAPTDFTLIGTIARAAQPPTLQSIAGEFTDAQARSVDFDGAYTLAWQTVANAQKYEIEQSTDGTNFTVLADVNSNVTSQSLTGQADGTHYYRVRALTPGQIGYYVTPASNVQSIVVNLRSLVDITNQVRSAISNVSLSGGVFSLDLNLTNQSTSNYLPLVRMNVVGITSPSGTVRTANADNNGSGVSPANAALFDYSNQLGTDQVFSAAETSGKRTLRFNDPASELFQFEVMVTAYFNNSAAANGSSSPSSGGSGSGSSNSLAIPGINLPAVRNTIRFTVNPLTRAVTAQLVLR